MLSAKNSNAAKELAPEFMAHKRNIFRTKFKKVKEEESCKENTYIFYFGFFQVNLYIIFLQKLRTFITVLLQLGACLIK